MSVWDPSTPPWNVAILISPGTGFTSSHVSISKHENTAQLNPGMPPDGMDRQEYLISKFGSSDAAKTVYENIYEEGVKEGINFNFDLIEIVR